VLISMCVLIFSCVFLSGRVDFLLADEEWSTCIVFSYQVGRTSSLLMGNGACAPIRGVGMVDLKLTSGKTVQLKKV
jgi:hypothetical protein